jgi:DNA-binding HxlR family transcriptional regulator
MVESKQAGPSPGSSTLNRVEATSTAKGPLEVCPHFHAAIELIGKRWTGAILCALTEGQLRFGELGKAVPGLSDRLLSRRLRELEDEGLVKRDVEAGSPVRVTYSLTEKGTELGPAIDELGNWARRWAG